MQLNPYQIIISPLISEKSTELRGRQNKYIFYIHPKANKIQVKKAIEEIYKVKVIKVNVIKPHPKKRRLGMFEGYKGKRKKAVVTLISGQTIADFEGV